MDINQKLSDLTDDQLKEKIEKITNIMYSRNQNLSRQAYPLFIALQEEQAKRDNSRLEEYLKKYGTKMDEVINIGL